MKKVVTANKTDGFFSVWQPIETAPHDRLILIGSTERKWSAAVEWNDGSDNHWDVPGFYESDALISQRVDNADVWMDLPVPPSILYPRRLYTSTKGE